MIDPTNLILAGVGVTGLLGGAAAALISVGRHGQRLADLEKARDEDRKAGDAQMVELKQRISAAETAAAAVQGLAVAIENMGDKFTTEVKHMVEKFGMETGFIREQLSDLKGQVRRRNSSSPGRQSVR